MEALIKQMDGVRLRRVDVKSWDSPVAVKNSIRELPTLWLYDGGKLVSSNSKDVAERLQRRAHG